VPHFPVTIADHANTAMIADVSYEEFHTLEFSRFSKGVNIDSPEGKALIREYEDVRRDQEKELFKMFDNQNDGRLDLEEYFALRHAHRSSAHNEATAVKQIQRIHEDLGQDGGTISWKEYKEYVGVSLSEKDRKDFFNQDKDGGKLRCRLL
jgi:Ca2+-binding EF-hand superfamily protein